MQPSNLIRAPCCNPRQVISSNKNPIFSIRPIRILRFPPHSLAHYFVLLRCHRAPTLIPSSLFPILIFLQIPLFATSHPLSIALHNHMNHPSFVSPILFPSFPSNRPTSPLSRTRPPPRCCFNERLKAHNDSLTRKVEESLLDAEQAPPPPSPSKPHPLPMQFELLAYHARNLARSKATRPSAESMYQRILHHDRTDGRAWIGLARLRFTDARYEDARATFREGSRSSLRNPHLLQAWGVFEERCGDTSRALSLFEAAVAADVNHCPSWVALGLWYQRYPRDYSKSAYCFSRGAEANPNNYYVWHVWGMLERQRQNYPAARRYFKKGIQANPRRKGRVILEKRACSSRKRGISDRKTQRPFKQSVCWRRKAAI